MTYEVGRRLIDGEWETNVESQGGGGGGGITRVTSDDETVTITNPTGPTVDLSAGGGSQPGALTSTEFLITEEATADNLSHAITAVDTEAFTFTIAGDHEDDFKGGLFTVSDSTGNDGIYTLVGVAVDGGDTTLFVAETIPDGTADGNVQRGLYAAEFAITEGTLVAAIEYTVEGLWAADGANLCTGTDSVTPYSFDDNVDLKQSPFDAVYDAGSGAGYALSGFSDFNVAPLIGAATTGGGVRYGTDDTLTIRIFTAIASPPVTPAGVLRVKIMYFTPVTATPAGLD